MDPKNIDQDVELNDNNEVEVDEAHDPENAEEKSNASVVNMAKSGVKKQAPARRADKQNQKMKAEKPANATKAGMISSAYDMMQAMTKEEVSKLLGVMAEDFDIDEDAVAESTVHIEADFSDDLNALVESEATLSEEFKAKTAIIFEAALKSKLSEEVDRLEDEYASELAEQVSSIKEDLVEKVDGYLNYVVENWMTENKLAIQQGLRTEIAENFMNGMKDLFVESYIEVPEAKVNLVDDLAETNSELEEQLNDAIGHAISLNEELEQYKRESIIREHSRDLAETQVERLKSLVEDIDFDDESTFEMKVKTVKESYFKKSKTTSNANITESFDDTDEDDTVESSPVMQSYLNAIRNSKR